MSIQALQHDFLKFRDHCIWLRNCHNTFNTLFADEEKAALLQRTAYAFFMDINTILQEYFFLQVRRITDPARTRGRSNLTISYVNDGLAELGILTAEIETLAERLKRYRDITSEIGNRVVAHNDHETAFHEGLVGEHGQAELDDFLEALQAYTDEDGRSLNIGPLDYRVQACAGDVHDLVRALRCANNSSSRRRFAAWLNSAIRQHGKFDELAHHLYQS